MKKIVKEKFWVIIPARSGSKSIKNKNLKKIGKKSLIEHSIKSAKEMNNVDKIVFSSDSKKYLNLASKNDVDICHHRSHLASQDCSTDLDFFKDFIKYYSVKDLPDFFIHLRPTTPLRKKKILNYALKYFLKNQNKFTSMRSVSKMSESSFKTFTIKNQKLCSINNSYELDFFNNPKNSFANTYFPNGYIDIIKTKNILKNFIHGNKVLPYIIKDNVIDIDSKNDLEYANYIFKQNKY
jgi:CMP-N,N'-diacetyllegionaminic acid synthase